MSRCDSILILSVLPAFEPNRIALRFRLKYLYNSGSPPQVRGKLVAITRNYREAGITPAGAGKTNVNPPILGANWDHPRRCGENLYFQLLAATTTGSPPQVRGKPDEVTAYQEATRITPAGAGKIKQGKSMTHLCKDHPRRCGENLLFGRGSRTPAGSPPQVRGKRGSRPHAAARRRITPAGAGKTQDWAIVRTGD